MARINYVPLSALQPVELQYNFYKNENFRVQKNTSRTGFSYLYTNSLNNTQDVVVNQQTCFILTSSVPLNTTFVGTTEYILGNLPGSFYFQPRNSLTFFAWRDPVNDIISLKQNLGSTFYINPINGTKQVEILVDGKFLQVEEAYPYRVVTNNLTLPDQFRYRQRFDCVYQNGTITFKTLTDEGYRYLSFGSDNILRATGVILNDTVINDYLFACIPVTSDTINAGFDPQNSIGTYFADFNNEINNTTAKINKTIPVKNNFLLSFPVKRDTRTPNVVVNVANLKTIITPKGDPPPIVNI